MKLKYSASLALALWLGVVAWVSAMIVAKPSVGRMVADGDESAAIAQLQLNINHNRQMLASVDALHALGDDAGAGPLVAPAPPADARVALDANGASGNALPGHRISMILASDEGRRAVIDGQFVAPGSRLADGSRVRGIGVDHVLLENAAGQRTTVRMPAPFAGASATEARP